MLNYPVVDTLFVQVTFLDTMKVWTDKDAFQYDLRVGWSTNSATRQLGEGGLDFQR